MARSASDIKEMVIIDLFLMFQSVILDICPSSVKLVMTILTGNYRDSYQIDSKTSSVIYFKLWSHGSTYYSWESLGRGDLKNYWPSLLAIVDGDNDVFPCVTRSNFTGKYLFNKFP
jgi:hypothetical protein